MRRVQENAAATARAEGGAAAGALQAARADAEAALVEVDPSSRALVGVVSYFV